MVWATDFSRRYHFHPSPRGISRSGSPPWKDITRSWHDTGPVDSLKPLSRGQHIKFGVVHAKDAGFGTDLIAFSNGAN